MSKRGGGDIDDSLLYYSASIFGGEEPLLETFCTEFKLDDSSRSPADTAANIDQQRQQFILKIHQSKNSTGINLGGHLWKGAQLLCNEIASRIGHFQSIDRVLELV
jgi:hypothetical protein